LQTEKHPGSIVQSKFPWRALRIQQHPLYVTDLPLVRGTTSVPAHLKSPLYCHLERSVEIRRHGVVLAVNDENEGLVILVLALGHFDLGVRS